MIFTELGLLFELAEGLDNAVLVIDDEAFDDEDDPLLTFRCFELDVDDVDEDCCCCCGCGCWCCGCCV